jgi:hypothetical protein
MRYIIIVLGLFINGCFTYNGFKQGRYVPDRAGDAVLPFDYISELIIVDATIGDVQGRFLYDNGFSKSALSPSFAERVVRGGKHRNTTVTDANSKKLRTSEFTVDTIDIGGHLFLKTRFILIDPSVFFPCDHIDGVIGASIINKANWQIDFGRQLMVLSDERFDVKGHKLKCEFANNNSAFTTLRVQGEDIRCKIDFGSTSNVKVNGAKYGHLFEGYPAEWKVGITSLSGTGLGNVDTVYYIRQPIPLQQNGTDLPIAGEVQVNKSLKYEGYIGIDYFKDYKLTIHSKDREYVLTPHPRSDTTQKKGYGLAIYPIGDKWQIINFNPRDTALTGIKLMDEVAQVDTWPVAHFKDICDFRTFLREKSAAGDTMYLRLKGEVKSLVIPYRETYLAPLSTDQ